MTINVRDFGAIGDAEHDDTAAFQAAINAARRMTMWKAIKEMLESKKALTMAVSAAVWIAGKAGLHLDNTELLGAVVPMWTYILAQAHVDHAKAKAQLPTATAVETK